MRRPIDRLPLADRARAIHRVRGYPGSVRRLVLAASVLAAASGLAAPPAGAALRITLTATPRAPAIGQAWRWTVAVRDGKTAVPARVKLQILLGAIVVGCWKGGTMAQCAGAAAGDSIVFKGVRTGVIRWPAESAGVPLTFRAVVTARGVTRRLTAPVRVKPAAP